MTKIKLCGLTRIEDIEAANALKPEYIGFVFTPKSRRYVDPQEAAILKRQLNSGINAVGVFVDEEPKKVAELLDSGIIDMAQLHGSEDENYIKQLRMMTDKPIIKAFRIDREQDFVDAQESSADYILLDSGNGGTGTAFDWQFIGESRRPYFLAGGLNPENVKEAVERLHPYAVDVSSGIETAKVKDIHKMEAFVYRVRGRLGKEEIE